MTHTTETATDAGVTETEDRGVAMSVVDGAVFFPLDARPDEISIETIAHALSMQCRFGGHSLDFYSVAQHSVLVSRLVPAEDALCALLHDATEAYIGDLIRPMKRALPEFVAIENRLWAAIATKFGLPADMPKSVLQADNIALSTEKRDVLAPQKLSWGPLPDPCETRITNFESPRDAKAAFLARYAELTA